MGTMFPIMLGLGLSAASAAGVIATSLGVAYTPTAIDAIRGSEAVNMDVVEYVVYHQGPAALATVLIVGISHFSGRNTVIVKQEHYLMKLVRQRSWNQAVRRLIMLCYLCYRS